MKAFYKPEIFNVADENHAKRIILTPEGSTTEERWAKETPFLVYDIGSFLDLHEDSLILDYGCGIGRISRELILHYRCQVLGLDISKSMRELSVKYVSNDNFCVMAKPLLQKLIGGGLKVDACIAIWVLQHCPNVETEIAVIKSALKKNGLVYILNNNASAIPTDKGWLNDGVSIRDVLERYFSVISYSRLPVQYASEALSRNTFIAKLRYR